MDKIYTLAEAAEHLRLTTRGVAKIAKAHGLCMVHGRKILLTGSDIEGIKQVLRAAPKETRRPPASIVLLPSDLEETLFAASPRPPVGIDRRMIQILEWLSRQKDPKSHIQIERAGPKTIQTLLAKGLLVSCGEDDDGAERVAISPSGRDVLKEVERWRKLRKQRGWSGKR